MICAFLFGAGRARQAGLFVELAFPWFLSGDKVKGRDFMQPAACGLFCFFNMEEEDSLIFMRLIQRKQSGLRGLRWPHGDLFDFFMKSKAAKSNFLIIFVLRSLFHQHTLTWLLLQRCETYSWTNNCCPEPSQINPNSILIGIYRLLMWPSPSGVSQWSHNV